jgi:hypothetical protein
MVMPLSVYGLLVTLIPSCGSETLISPFATLNVPLSMKFSPGLMALKIAAPPLVNVRVTKLPLPALPPSKSLTNV